MGRDNGQFPPACPGFSPENSYNMLSRWHLRRGGVDRRSPLSGRVFRDFGADTCEDSSGDLSLSPGTLLSAATVCLALIGKIG